MILPSRLRVYQHVLSGMQAGSGLELCDQVLIAVPSELGGFRRRRDRRAYQGHGQGRRRIGIWGVDRIGPPGTTPTS